MADEETNLTTEATEPERATGALQEPEIKPALVFIRRVPGKEPVTCISVPREAFYHWQPDEKQDEFEVEEDVAIAAVASGGFTRTKPVKTDSKGD